MAMSFTVEKKCATTVKRKNLDCNLLGCRWRVNTKKGVSIVICFNFILSMLFPITILIVQLVVFDWLSIWILNSYLKRINTLKKLYIKPKVNKWKIKNLLPCKLLSIKAIKLLYSV